MGCGSSAEFRHDVHVVIIGGGYAGFALAYDLLRKRCCQVTLIDPKEFMVHCVAALRAAAVKGFARNIFVPYESVLGGIFLRGTVDTVNTQLKYVTLQDGRRIFISQRILIVGGGSVGVELAGEIRFEHRHKEITVIHSGENLVSSKCSRTFQRRLKKKLAANDIDIILNERVEDLDELVLNRFAPDQVVGTSTRRMVVADLVITCTGFKIQTQFCRSAFDNVMRLDGTIRVDKYLHVEGHDDVFAIGDVCNLEEEKLAMNARRHAQLVSVNLQRAMKNRKLKPYKPLSFMMVLPIGGKQGVCQLYGMVFGDYLARKFKGSNLQVKRTWKDVGLHTPPPYRVDCDNVVSDDPHHSNADQQKLIT